MRAELERPAEIEATVEERVEASPVAKLDALVEELEPTPEQSQERTQVAAPPQLATARAVSLEARTCVVAWRGRQEVFSAEVAPDVDLQLVGAAIAGGSAVLVEHGPGLSPVVVGVLQTQVAREVVVKGSTITVEAEQEVLLRAGRAALRLRADGDVELVGTRISASSRGLFRLVGRILRLN